MRAIRGLSLASLDLHAELASLGTSFEQHGTVGVYETGDSLAAARLEAEASGLRVQLLSAKEACALEPALRPGLAGAVYYPDDAHLDPLRYVRAVGDAAASAGAELRAGVEVRAIRRLAGGIAVETTDRAYRPEAVVLAAGAWTGRLSHSLGVFIPLTGGKGYHIDFASTAGDPEVPVWIHEGRLVAAPTAGRIRVAGTLELGSFDLSINPRRIEAIRRAAGRALPGLRGRGGGETWAGLRPCTPDGLPVIGRPSREPSLILATGHAMKGVALAPVTARLVSELVAGEPSSQDLAPFSPDRFRPLLGSLSAASHHVPPGARVP